MDEVYEKAREPGDIFNISFYADQDREELFFEVFAMHEVGEPLPDYITEMLMEVINVS